MKSDHTFLEKLVNCISPSGSEIEVNKLIGNEIKPFVSEVYTDVLGNLIAHRKGSGKKFMLTAHADEIGMMASSVDKSGFVRICALGGINPLTLIGRRAVFSNGTRGIIFRNGYYENKNYEFSDLFMDIGADSKEEAEKKVRIGDVCVLEADYFENGGFMVGRTMDDRIGCYVLTELIKLQPKTDYDLYYVFATQEEIGGIGAWTAAFNIEPDIGIAVDVAPTGDVLKDRGPSKYLPVSLCGGPVIRYKDGGIISNRNFVEAIKKTAWENDVKCQWDVLDGAKTDSAAIQQSGHGALSICVNIPTRYIHSPNQVVTAEDTFATVRLLKLILETYKF